MVRIMNTYKTIFYKTVLTTTATLSLISAALAQNSEVQNSVPTLIVTNKPIAQVSPQVQVQPMPGRPASPVVGNRIESVNQNLYAKPVRVPGITAESVLNPDYFSPVDTMTSQQINQIQQRLYDLQAQVADKASELQTLQIVGQDLAANYYASVATISTQLQSGTTPGNPRLKNRLMVAEDALDTLSGNVADLNKLAIDVADLATVSNFLQQEARAAYGLSGSVEEDHVQLAQLEDAVSNTAVAIERLLNGVNDDITRSAAYMASERQNLRTLALAISNGDLYGKSLASRPFSNAVGTNIMNQASFGSAAPSMGMPMASVLQQPRPLMKIRFDRPDVDYTQALYMSVNDAMKKYPSSSFELVAVSPGMGNPAKVAIESTRARRNAEKVLRNMVQMGVNTNRVNLANLTKDDVQYNEVHLYVR
jgi:hypothetical protein